MRVLPGDEALVRRALKMADRTASTGDVPVGCVVADRRGAVIATGWNQREAIVDPTAHAEIVALRAAAQAVGSWDLSSHTLAVTLEPCAMCAGAIVLARIPRLVFGAWDPKAGAAGSQWDLVRDPRLNHRPEVVGGVLEGECAQVLWEFFGDLRNPPPKKLAD